MKQLLHLIAILLPFPVIALSSAQQVSSANPSVRAITAFVRLDKNTWEKQIAEALIVLRKTQKEFESSGYRVESVRIVTQPVASAATSPVDLPKCQRTLAPGPTNR